MYNLILPGVCETDGCWDTSVAGFCGWYKGGKWCWTVTAGLFPDTSLSILVLLTWLEPGGEGDIPPPPAVYSSLRPIIRPEPLVDVLLWSVRPLRSKN